MKAALLFCASISAVATCAQLLTHAHTVRFGAELRHRNSDPGTPTPAARPVEAAIGPQAGDIVARSQPPAPARPRWKEGAILVWIDARSGPAGADALVERAMKAWTDASGRRVHLDRTSDRNAAPLRVHFIAGDNVYGEARPRVG